MSNDLNKLGEIRIDALVNQINVDATISDVASKWGMAGGTVTTFYGWITSSAAAILIGILVTIGGFIINYYFQRKRHEKEMEFNQLRTELLLKDEERKELDERRKQERHEIEIQRLKSNSYD